MEKATPVKNTVGNRIRRRPAQRAAVSGSKPSASRPTMGSARAIPSRENTAVSRPTQVKKQWDSRKASSRPCCSIRSAKTGIKLAEMAEANMASKKVRGIRLAT